MLIEKVHKFWCVTTRRSRGGLPEDVWNTLSFGVIQNVKGEGNCGAYAAVEGLLNCLIPVSTDVKRFEKRHMISLIIMEIRFYPTSFSEGIYLQMER